jgi:UDP-2,3-diacylglucosamine pyrophosphatase LpxH
MITLKNIQKIFILGDLHLGIKNNSIEWSDIQSSYLINDFLNDIDSQGFNPDTDILVQVGDWNHVRESTNVRIYKLSLQIAEAFTKKFKRGVHVILGNHDVYYKDRTDTHSLEGFNKIYSNFHIYDKPSELLIGSHKILMLPWIENLVDLKNKLSQYKSNDFVFCHADVKGFSLNSFTKLEHGLEQKDIIPFKRIYSGHIHIRQEKGNVLYVGTPYEMDRGDFGNQKGYYILDVSGPTIKETFIPNKTSPQHLKINIIDLLNKNYLEISKLFKNNFIDILIESELVKIFPISQFTELVKDYGHRRLDFITYSKEKLKTRSEIEQETNYEYNVFTLLENRIKVSQFPDHISNQIFLKFKEIYDSLRNTKQYN